MALYGSGWYGGGDGVPVACGGAAKSLEGKA